MTASAAIITSFFIGTTPYDSGFRICQGPYHCHRSKNSAHTEKSDLGLEKSGLKYVADRKLYRSRELCGPTRRPEPVFLARRGSAGRGRRTDDLDGSSGGKES